MKGKVLLWQVLFGILLNLNHFAKKITFVAEFGTVYGSKKKNTLTSVAVCIFKPKMF